MQSIPGYRGYLLGRYQNITSCWEQEERVLPTKKYLTPARFDFLSNSSTPASDASRSAALEAPRITVLDQCIRENTNAHYTSRYEVTKIHTDELSYLIVPGQLVVRRGMPFIIKLTMNRMFDPQTDSVKVTAQIGTLPLPSQGTYSEVIAGSKATQGHWTVDLVSVTSNEVELSLLPPADCAVGRWRLSFATMTTDAVGNVYNHSSPANFARVYILFNAWCKDDPVYMEDEDQKSEYLLNDTGKMYTGNYHQMFGKAWNYGQFDDITLKAAFWLLEHKGRMHWTAMGNPVLVARKISALVNGVDDDGILTGRWDGHYAFGVSPTKWNGSVAILKKYMESKQPVRYGQCLTFAGVFTTIARALGIPTRPVTNFSSAHDTDGSLTIDVYWNENNQPNMELNTDLVWNFHVWNEVYMIRKDLPARYSGWQAVDGTPQIASDGIYCSGPAAVRAIKQGDVNTAFDVAFIFSEVNADRVHWIRQSGGYYRTLVERDVVGKRICTKRIGPCLGAGSSCDDMEDITNEYKFPEGTSEERAAVWKAVQMSTKPKLFNDDNPIKDVKFEILDIENINLGQDFDVPVRVINTSFSVRTVLLQITLSSIYYTGVSKRHIKSQTFERVLQPEESCSFRMHVCAAEYLAQVLDHTYDMKINYLANVSETKQLFATEDDFRVRSLIPHIVPSRDVVKLGEIFSVAVSFENPLHLPLTGCVFSFEAAGNLKPVDIATSEVQPGAMAYAKCDITAKRVGDCVVIVSFESRELGDIQGQCTVKVLSGA